MKSDDDDDDDIQFEITQFTNEIINFGWSNAYDEQLNNILQTAFKTKSITRNEVIQQCMDAKNTIYQFKDVLSE